MQVRLRINVVSAFLLLLLLISVNCWNLKPLMFLFTGNRGLLLFMVAIFAGCWIFRGRASREFLSFKNYLLLILIILGIVISFIPAKLYWGQSLLVSAIAVRRTLYFLTLPVLLIIRPSLYEIKRALSAFSVLYFMMVILCSVFGLDILYLSEEQILKREISLNVQPAVLEGYIFVAIEFVLSVSDFMRNVSWRKVIMPLMCFVAIILYQNRTAIFACIICCCWMLVTLPNTKRLLRIKIVSVISFVAVLFLSWGILYGLFEETVSDLSNLNYNRTLAYAYFLVEAPQGPMSILMGNGFISSKASPIMADLMEQGIFNSDVGFIGLWNQFGLLPIVAILTSIFIPFKRRLPKQMQALSTMIVCCSLTVAYFFASQTIVWLCLYLYMIVLFSNRKLRRWTYQ